MRRSFRPMKMAVPIMHDNPDDPLDGQSKGIHFLGLDLVNSAVGAMGWSFLASFFSGATAANDNVREGFKLFALGSVAEAGRRLCSWAFDRFRIREFTFFRKQICTAANASSTGYCVIAHFNEGDPAYEWLVNYLVS